MSGYERDRTANFLVANQALRGERRRRNLFHSSRLSRGESAEAFSGFHREFAGIIVV